MIQLYQAGGASDFTILPDELPREECRVLFDNAARLLSARHQARAAEILRSVPFRVVAGTNHFEDEFSMLHANVPLDEYERLRGNKDGDRQAYRQIAVVLRELGHFIRFITVELILERPAQPDAQRGLGLTQAEIKKLVYKYIGVSGGYLGDFSYRTHHEFYLDLDLDIDPSTYAGTTRERFMTILDESSPLLQARILEGVLDRFPVGSSKIRTEFAAEIRKWILRLRTGPHVEQPALRISSEVVERALLDAQALLVATGATSGVDRLHTALHGYLREVCGNAGLSISEDASLTDLFKKVRESHPAFRDLGPRSEDILKVLRALASILDSLNPLRNKASVAHPNLSLLPEAESKLVINAARSILHYVDEKVYRHGISGEQ